MFEYKYIIVPISISISNNKTKKEGILELEKITNNYALDGWKLSQIFSPVNGSYVEPKEYVIVLEKIKSD